MQPTKDEEKYSKTFTWQAYLATRLEHIWMGIFLDTFRHDECKRLRPKKPQVSRRDAQCKKKKNKAAAARMRRHDERKRAAGNVRKSYWAKPEAFGIAEELLKSLGLARWKRLLRFWTLLRLFLRSLIFRTES